MKRTRWICGEWMVLATLLLGGAVRVAAQDAPQANESQETDDADKEAKTPEGAAKVRQRIADEFHVDPSRVDQLRKEQNLGYGEIRHALTLAGQLPGGITDDNVNQVMQMRQDQHMGWGQIAHQLGGNLGQIEHGDTQTTTTPAEGTPTGGSSTTTSGEPGAQAESLTRPGKHQATHGHAAASDAGGLQRPGSGAAHGGAKPHGFGAGHGHAPGHDLIPHAGHGQGKGASHHAQ